MGYLRHKVSGAVTDLLSPDSLEYQKLAAIRSIAVLTAQVPAGVSGEEAGGTYALPIGSALWEDVSEAQAGLPDPAGGRVLVLYVPPTATAANSETVDFDPAGSNVAGTLTDVEYVPDAAIPGTATNNRVITLNQVTVTGTPTRVTTALAAVTFDATHSGVAKVPFPLAISQAAFTAAAPEVLQVVSSVNGTGQPDPGGIVYAIYTRT